LLGNKHAEVAKTLLELAELEEYLGRAKVGLIRYEEAIATLTSVLGADHWRVAEAKLNHRTAVKLARLTKEQQLNLKQVHARTASYAGLELEKLAAAVPKIKGDIRTIEKTIGVENRLYISAKLRLARLCAQIGRFSEAHGAYDAAASQFDEETGADALFARNLTLWSRIQRALANHAAAVGYAKQSERLTIEHRGIHNEFYLNRLRALSNNLYYAGRKEKALLTSEKLLRIHLQVRGEDHPLTAQILSDLAHAYLDMHEMSKARDTAQAALTAFGDHDSESLAIMDLVAKFADADGENEKARRLYTSIERIARQTVGTRHPRYAGYLTDMSHHYFLAGDLDKSIALLERLLAIDRGQLNQDFDAQSERQQHVRTAELRGRLYAYVSHSLLAGGREVDIYQQLKNWKGAISAKQMRIRRSSVGPEAIRIRGEMAIAASELSSLVNRDHRHIDELRPVASDTAERFDELERQIAQVSVGNAQIEQIDSWASFVESYPTDTALVDFYIYNHLSSERDGKGWFKDNRESRLLAFILRPNQALRLVELGAVAPISDAANLWRKHIQAGRGHSSPSRVDGPAPPQTTIRQLVWEPIAPHLEGAATIVVSPDGPINDIPLGALPGDEPGSYLIEQAAFTRVPFPVWKPQRATSQSEKELSLLAVGDVDFGAGRRGAGGLRLLQSQFQTLPGTAREVSAVESVFSANFPSANGLLGTRDRATELFFRQNAPRHNYLHIATHGFFVSEQPNGSTKNGNGRLVDLAEVMAPGVLCGIALAGANQTLADSDGENDGLLTALEISTLDLTNVRVAVLSACETSLGAQRTGEGMLGLQRALHVAGVRTSVPRFWQVDDAATMELMKEFYANIWERKMNRSEALRQAQVAMLKRYDPKTRTLRSRGIKLIEQPGQSQTLRLPPVYWAAFTLCGDWQ
jgi:CHAT domain-containing protein/tetratricopeptide (TPR) repeat protein